MRFLSALLVLLPVAACAQEQGFFPLREGNTWVFTSKVKVGVKLGPLKLKQRVKTPLAVTAVCGAPRRIGEQIYHPITWTDNTGAPDAKIWVRTEGTRIIIDRAVGSRVLLLPGDLSQSSPVDLNIGFGGKRVSFRDHRVHAALPLSVPAGTFTAVPVDAKLQLSSFKARIRVAYGQGVGPIWIEEELNISGKKTSHSLVLRSFTPGAGRTPRPQPTQPLQPLHPEPVHPEPVHPEPVHPEPLHPEPLHPEPMPPNHPESPPEVAPLPPAPVAQPPQGSGIKLISELVAHGQPNTWRIFEERTQALVARSAELGFAPTLRGLPNGHKVVRGLSSRAVVDDLLLVSEGSVTVLGLDEAVIFVNGDVTIAGNVLDSIVVCTGKLTVTGIIKASLVLSRSDVLVVGYVKASLFQAQRVTSRGTSKGCVYVKTKRKALRSRDDTPLNGVHGPLDLLAGR